MEPSALELDSQGLPGNRYLFRTLPNSRAPLFEREKSDSRGIHDFPPRMPSKGNQKEVA